MYDGAVKPSARLGPALAAAAVTPGLATGAAAQSYRFPVSDADYAHFYPTAYKDHAGVDWACGDIRYDDHQGSDFGGGSWAGMAEGRDIVAAAPGLVVETHDGEDDQCSTGDCPGGGGYGNYVVIRHPDGKSTLYGHLKTGSVAVTPGQFVTCATLLGQMGSSGHSTGPHLHFGVKTLDGAWADPFWGDCSGPPSYWVDQGTYGGLPAATCPPPPPTCAASAVVTCGAALDARNDGPGSTAEHGHYGCGLEFVYSGSELAWSFVTDLDEPVTLTVSGLTADLSLHVLASDACDGSDCVGYSDASASNDEVVTFQAAAGKKYVVVVDGYEGAASDLHLAIACDGGLPVDPGAGGGGSGGAGGGGGSAGNGGGGSGGNGDGGGVPADGGCGCRITPSEERGRWLAAAFAFFVVSHRRQSRARRAPG